MFKLEDFELGDLIFTNKCNGIILGIHCTEDRSPEILIAKEKIRSANRWSCPDLKSTINFLMSLRNFRSQISPMQIMQFNLEWIFFHTITTRVEGTID